MAIPFSIPLESLSTLVTNKSSPTNCTLSPILVVKFFHASQSSSSNWTTKDGSHNWRSGDHEASINIPLKNNFTLEDKTPASLDEIQIEYQDFFPKNPSQFSFEMAVLEKQTSTFQKNPPIWKKKIVTAIPTQLSMPKIKENLFATSIKKKNGLYLIKRGLGLPFDPSWRFTQDDILAKTYGNRTVFQRRFDMDLRFIEFIDIVFRENVTENDLNNFRCNFRITHTETAKTLKIVPGAEVNIAGTSKWRITDKLGNYAFQINEPGSYQIIVNPPFGYSSSQTGITEILVKSARGGWYHSNLYLNP